MNRFPVVVLLLSLSACTVDRSEVPVVSGSGVTVGEDGTVSVSSEVPVVSVCSQGQLVRKTASGWECIDVATLPSVTAFEPPLAKVGSVLGLTFGGDGAAASVSRSDHSHAGYVSALDARLGDARTPTGAAAGDLGGTYPGPSVMALRGRALSAAAPGAGQVLAFDGAQWAPSTVGRLTDGGDLVGATAGDLQLFVRPDGSDTACDGLGNLPATNGKPCALQTPQAAVDRVPYLIRHEVVIEISTGTYRAPAGVALATVQVSKSVELGGSLFVRARSGETVILSGLRPNLTDRAPHVVVVSNQGPGTVGLEGLGVQNASAIALWLSAPGGSVGLSDVTVSQAPEGVRFSNCAACTLEGDVWVNDAPGTCLSAYASRLRHESGSFLGAGCGEWGLYAVKSEAVFKGPVSLTLSPNARVGVQASQHAAVEFESNLSIAMFSVEVNTALSAIDASSISVQGSGTTTISMNTASSPNYFAAAFNGSRVSLFGTRSLTLQNVTRLGRALKHSAIDVEGTFSVSGSWAGPEMDWMSLYRRANLTMPAASHCGTGSYCN